MKLPTEETFESIYLSCFPKLVIYLQQYTANLQDAEDIASQAMMILWNKWDTMSSHTRRGLQCWLTVTVKNLLKEENKKKKRTPPIISLDDLPPNLHPEMPPETDPLQEEEEFRKQLERLAAQLPAADAQLLYDKIVNQMSHEEIAAQLGVSVNTIHIRWTRAKKRIAKLIRSDSSQSSK